MRNRQLIWKACFLRDKEYTFGEISKEINVPKSTVQRWVNKYFSEFHDENSEFWTEYGPKSNNSNDKRDGSGTLMGEHQELQDGNGPNTDRFEYEFLKNSIENLSKRIDSEVKKENYDDDISKLRGTVANNEFILQELSNKSESAIKTIDNLTFKIQKLEAEITILKVLKGIS